MRYSVVIALMCCFFIPQKGISCFCVSLDLASEVKYADVVFLGKLVEKYENPAIYSPTTGSYRGLKYFNLEVIKYHKGLSEFSTKISVFDRDINGSCESLFTHFKIGDTILVMGKILSQEHFDRLSFLESSGCRRNVAMKNFSMDEITFVNNHSLWKIPQESDMKKYFPKEEKPVEVLPNRTWFYQWILLVGFLVSVCINALLILKLVRDKPVFNSKPLTESDLL